MRDAQDRALAKRLAGKLREAGIEAGTDGDLHVTDRTIDFQDQPGEPELVAYVFTDAHITKIAAGLRGGGTDKFVMTFEGKGGPEWRATYESGEAVARGAPREFLLDSLVLDVMTPVTTEKAPEPMQLALRGRSLWAKVATGATDDDGNTAITATVEMSVYRHGGGFVQDPTGDVSHDASIMSPALYEAIGRISGLQGSLTLVRAAEAQQGDMFESKPEDPCPAPEGVKERTLNRGKRPAVQAFEKALSASDVEGNPVEVEVVRAFYDATADAILRTWDGGPVKVVVAHAVKYVMAMPGPDPEGEGSPKAGKDLAGDQGED